MVGKKGWYVVKLSVYSALILAVVMTAGCCWFTVRPDWKPTYECVGKVGLMQKEQGKIFESLQDCYVCELVQRCFTEGNQYCCKDNFCSECHTSPLWSVQHKDAGTSSPPPVGDK